MHSTIETVKRYFTETYDELFDLVRTDPKRKAMKYSDVDTYVEEECPTLDSNQISQLLQIGVGTDLIERHMRTLATLGVDKPTKIISAPFKEIESTGTIKSYIRVILFPNHLLDEWFCIEKQLHSSDEPAIYWANGDLEWYYRGLRHRYDGPAFIKADGTEMYFYNGVLHRNYVEYDGKVVYGGPAIRYPDGSVEYWVDGVKLPIC
jgi:hypothetical protein